MTTHLDEIEKALEEHHAMDAVWPIQRSPKTRDALDQWTLEAQKEADEWSGMKRPVHMTKPDGLMHADPSNDPRTLGERLKGGE